MKTVFLFIFLLSLTNAALTDSLTAYWAMENTQDSTSNNYDLKTRGTVSNVAAKLNNGYDCDNTGIINASNIPIGSTDWTFSFWRKDQGFIGSYMNSMDRWGTSNAKPIQLFTQDLATDRHFYYWGNGASQAQLLYDSAIDTTAFHHWIFRRKQVSGSNYNMSIWKDNIRVASTTSTQSVADDTTIPFYICWHPGIGYSNMIVDEFGVWARALSEVEISELYNGGAGLGYPFYVYSMNSTFNVTDYDCGNTNITVKSNLDYFLIYEDSTLIYNGTESEQIIAMNWSKPGEHNYTVKGYEGGELYETDQGPIFFYPGPGYCLTEHLNSTVNTEVLMVWLVLLYIAAVASTLFMPGMVAIPSALFAGTIAIYAYTEQGQTFWILGALLPMGFMFIRGRR